MLWVGTGMQENNSIFSYEDKLDIYTHLFLKYGGLYDKRFSLTDIYKTLDSYNIFSRKMFKQNLDTFHSLINFPLTVESKNTFQAAIHKRIFDLSNYLFSVEIIAGIKQNERKLEDGKRNSVVCFGAGNCCGLAFQLFQYFSESANSGSKF